MMMRTGASRRTRWRLLLAAAALAILQLASVSHLIGHTAAGDSAGCAICLAASGSGGAIPAASITLPVFHSATNLVVDRVAGQLPARIVANYRARAPPFSV